MRNMQTCWLNFGLVSVPVKVGSVASDRDNVTLNGVHLCGSPPKRKGAKDHRRLVQLKNASRCPECQTLVEDGEKLSGFALAKNVFVQVDRDEFAQFTSVRSNQIDLTKFVPAAQVEPTLVEKLYYLSPSEHVVRPYELLAAAMFLSDVAGIGKVNLRGVDKPCSVGVLPNGLMAMAMLHTADTLQNPNDELGLLQGDVDGDELKVAQELLALKGGELEPSDLVSEARDRQRTYIESVTSGIQLQMPEKPVEKITTDVGAAMREMLRAAKEGAAA